MKLVDNQSQTKDPYDNLALLIMQTRRAIYKEMEREYSKVGITPEQHGVLTLLMTNKSATVKDVATRMLREPHTILGLINRMVARDLITKTKNVNNKGLITIRLTDKGRELCQEVESIDRRYQPTSVLADLEYIQVSVALRKVLNGCLSRLGLNP